jgi:hypothetical protein
MSGDGILKEFLEQILPNEGHLCGVSVRAGGFHHRFFQTTADLAAFILAEDALGHTVYFACSSYREPTSRKGANVHGAQSLWLDVDAGPGKPYDCAATAAEAVVQLCRSTGLPSPIFVGSGNGIHVYWPLDRMLEPREWRPLALSLKQKCEQYGLHADPGRTADMASILRPPETHNRKKPNIPRLVQVGPLHGPYAVDELRKILGVAIANEDHRAALNAAIATTYTPPPYSELEERRIRSALARIPAEEWRDWLNMGMALHSTGWGDLAFRIWDEWSQTAPHKYDESVQAKTWASFDRPYDGARITLGTLFYLAERFGWSESSSADENGKEVHAGKETSDQLVSQSNNPTRRWDDYVVSAAELRKAVFDPISYILPGFITEGVTLLVGRPKVGKSWWILDVCLAVASGQPALSKLRPESGDVLYLALEDGKRRLQSRLDKLLSNGNEWPESLKLVPLGGWRRSDEGGLQDIADWCRSVKKPTLIVIDTLERFRKPANGKSPLYSADYEAITGLQKIANENRAAIVVLHHDRKSDAEDAFDTVSGTLGLTGAADTILIIKKRNGGVVLYARGRDVEESETAMQFNKALCRWMLLGGAAEVQRSLERERITAALRASGGPLSVQDLVIEAEMRNRNATDILLSRLVKEGAIVRVARGKYALPKINGQIGQKERTAPQAAGFVDKYSNLSDLSVSEGEKIELQKPGSC